MSERVYPKMRFARADVHRLVAHATAATEWSEVYGKGGDAPGLILVHDDGVYLMSNGKPGDMVERVGRKSGKKTEMHFVAYAAGTDPAVEEFDDWWELSRALVGGDDFGMPFPIGWAVDFLAGNGEVFEVAFEGESGMVYLTAETAR
jgi:hypothetical protein